MKTIEINKYLTALIWSDSSITLQIAESTIEFPLYNQELANIPHVKSLIEALELAEFSSFEEDEEGSHCPLCGNSDYKGHHDLCEIKNALAPFRKNEK